MEINDYKMNTQFFLQSNHKDYNFVNLKNL